MLTRNISKKPNEFFTYNRSAIKQSMKEFLSIIFLTEYSELTYESMYDNQTKRCILHLLFVASFILILFF